MAGQCFRIPALLAGLAVGLSSGGAWAADYSPPPPPVFIPPPPVVEVVSGWYLRGDIGITNQQIDNLTNILDVNNSVRNVGLGFDSSGLVGLGFGYHWNDWLRIDFTGEYRSRANFHGSQIITSGGNTYTNEYSASKSEWLFLANAYFDLGTWHGFTPFIGAGIGGARITIHSFEDINTPNLGVAFADDASKWNFAWALHAGIGYKVTKNVVIELAYRYVNLGDAESGDIYTYLGTNNVYNPMQFEKLTSHDIKLGVRFNLHDDFDFWSRPKPTYIAPAPVYTQPAPVYAPPPAPVYHQPAPVYQPPVYPQYPIRSRG
ncbi:MAG: outer membrane protein [Pseudolabrys sp.]